MKKSSVLCVLGAASLWGFISLFVRGLASVGFDNMQIVCSRCVFSALLLLVPVLIRSPRLLLIRLKDAWLFAGTGLMSMLFFNWCYFTTIQRSEAGIAVVLLYTSPIWVMLFSAVLFREKITPRKLLALALTFLGCVLVAGRIGSSIGPDVLLVGLGAGLGYALYSIFGQMALRRGYDTLTLTIWTFLFASLGGLLLTPPLPLMQLCFSSFSHLALTVFGSLFCSVLPYLLYTRGLAGMEAGQAAILATAEPLVATLVGVFFWNETLTLTRCAGVALIFVAVLLLNSRPAKDRASI